MSMSVNGGDAASPGALLQPQASGVAIEAEARTRAPSPGIAPGETGMVVEPAASDPPWKSVPVRTGFLPDPSRVASAARGWGTAEGVVAAAARRASTSKRASPARAPAAAPGPSASATELAFLKDKRITIEDKLFLFMALMEKKGNQELQQALTDYAQRREKAQAAERAKAEASASGGGGFLGGLVDAVQGVVKQVGGPLLASAATAVGAPFLAPAALSVGGSLGADLVGTVADLAGIEHGKKKASAPRAPGSSASSSGASAASPADEFDEKLEFAKLQRLYEKQQAMFNCLSNLMKAMHDTQMATVNNLR